jgi:hypothetical protein
MYISKTGDKPWEMVMDFLAKCVAYTHTHTRTHTHTHMVMDFLAKCVA